MSEAIDAERLQASAVQFLIEGQEEDAASVLLSCSLDVWESGDTWFVGDEIHHALHVELTGPRAAYEVLTQESHPMATAVRRAIEAVQPPGTYVKHYTVAAKLIDITPDWRTELLEIARGRGVHNQAAGVKAPRLWNGLRFRSESEVRIAQALDRAGILFLPNCLGRVGPADGRKVREADFLVCHDGKWGILEVDGEPFHPPSRTAEDHERDRLYRAHGVRVVEHFDATDCYQRPDQVVREFIAILARS